MKQPANSYAKLGRYRIGLCLLDMTELELRRRGSIHDGNLERIGDGRQVDVDPDEDNTINGDLHILCFDLTNSVLHQFKCASTRQGPRR